MDHLKSFTAIHQQMAEKQLTLKLKQAAKMPVIAVAGHLIITSESYFLFADMRLI